MPNTKNVTFPAGDAPDADENSSSSSSTSGKMAQRTQPGADYRIIRQAQHNDHKEPRHIPSPPWASDSYVSKYVAEESQSSTNATCRDGTNVSSQPWRSDARHPDAQAHRDGRASRAPSVSRSDTSGDDSGRAETAKSNPRYHPYAQTSSPAPHPRLYHQPHQQPQPPDSSEMANSSAVDPPQHPPLITVPFDPHRSTRPRQRHAPIGTATINFGSTSPPPTPPTSTATRTTDGSLSPSASSPDTSMDYDSVQPSQGKTRGRRTSGGGGPHHPSSSSSSALPQRNSYYRDRPSLSPRRQATQDLERLLDSNTSASSNNHVLSGIGQNHYRTQYSASGYGGPGGTTNSPDSTMGGRVSRSVSASASTTSSSNTSTSPIFTAVPSTPSAVISPNVNGANSNTFAAPARPSRKTKKYPCDICGAIFTRSGDVRRHKDSKHEPGEGCKCPYCDRVLTRQDALQRHWDKYCRQKSKRHVEKPVSGAPSSPKSPANPTASSSRPAGEYDRRPKRGRNTSGAAALLSAAAAVAASGAEASAAEDVRMRDPKGGRDGDVGNGRELREEEDDDENDMAAHSTATVTPATYRHIPASSTSASGMFSIISPGPGVGRGYGGGGRKAAAASSSASSSNRWTSTPPPPTGSSPSSAMAHNGGTTPGGGSVASAYASSGNNGAGATNPYPGSSGYPQYKYFQPPSSFPSSQPQTQINPRDAHKTAAHYEQPQAPSSSRRTRNSRAGGGGTGAGVGGAGVDVRSTSNSHSTINGTTTTPSVPSSSSTTSTTAAPSTRRAGLRDKTKGRRTTTQRNGASGGVADQEADAGGAGSGRLTLSSLAAAAAISAAVPVPVPSVGPPSSAMPSPNGSATSQGRGSHSNGNPSDYTSHRPPSPHLASSAFGSSSGNGMGGVASSSSLGRDSRADPGMGGVEVVHSPGSWAGDEDAEGEEEDAAMVMVQLGANGASTASVNASASAAPGGSGTGATPSTGPTPDHSHGPVTEDLGEDDADGEGDEDEMDVDHHGK